MYAVCNAASAGLGFLIGCTGFHVTAASEEQRESQHAPVLTLVSHQSRTETQKHAVNTLSDYFVTVFAGNLKHCSREKETNDDLIALCAALCRSNT